MNREFLHKITILGCLFLLITSSSGTDNGFQTPEQYAQIVQEHFANEEWEAGKELLEEGLQKYPNVSDLEWLMGKYWFHEKNYDQSRYHLVKAIDDNYNNVNAKHLLVDVEDITENYSSAICYVNELLEVNPYWRGLWRRKIELYRKQNNDVEADRLLKRINQIYPNDTILRKDYIYSMEVGYQQMKKGGNRKEAIEKLTQLGLPINLAISLHAAEPELRTELMPVNKGFPFQEVIQAAEAYVGYTGRQVTYEYILIAGKNDSPVAAELLANHLRFKHASVNLIPANPVPEKGFERPSKKVVEAFLKVLQKHKINATVRREMGKDIDAACGQLRARFAQEQQD